MGDKNGTKNNSNNNNTGGSSASGAVSGGNLSPVQSQAMFGTPNYAGSNVTQIGTQIVKEKVGIQPNISNPNQPATGGNITGYSSTSGNQMYGGSVSEETNKYLVDIGEATFNPATGSYTLTPTGHAIKYGSYNAGGPQTPSGAVGTGSGGGIMGATPITQEMFESQQKLKMLALAPLSLMAPFPVSSALGLAFNKARKEQYSAYIDSFNNSMAQPTTTSYAFTNKTQSSSTQASSLDSANAEYGATTQEIAAEAERQRKLALARKEAALNAKRTFFDGKKLTISGSMSGGL